MNKLLHETDRLNDAMQHSISIGKQQVDALHAQVRALHAQVDEIEKKLELSLYKARRGPNGQVKSVTPLSTTLAEKRAYKAAYLKCLRLLKQLEVNSN